MTDEELMKFKSLSMQDGKLNLKWFADYVAQAEREACAKLADSLEWADHKGVASAIRARSKGEVS